MLLSLITIPLCIRVRQISVETNYEEITSLDISEVVIQMLNNFVKTLATMLKSGEMSLQESRKIIARILKIKGHLP